MQNQNLNANLPILDGQKFSALNNKQERHLIIFGRIIYLCHV